MNNEDRIQPWKENPQYWQYKGKPVLLLGGSKSDGFFRIVDGEAHADEIAACGGNYVRHTMAQLITEAAFPQPIFPYEKDANGRYDLTRPSQVYWQKFADMLRWTAERDIIVQIEVWDRFDLSRGPWVVSPWNPANNVNYTTQASGLATDYPEHPGKDLQPFFHTVPGMAAYAPELDLVRHYQEAYVNKMLSYSLDYGHVLYCMNNETSTPPQWGQYWLELIRNQAQEKGVQVCVTDMFDDAHLGDGARLAKVVYDQPETYDFVDISQINSRNFDDRHWEVACWAIERNRPFHRPANHTKIYGGNYTHWGSGGNEDGEERFWRNLLAGSAACRSHRPPSGNGLNDRTKAMIRAARHVEARIKFWDVVPRMDLLQNRAPNAAYLAAREGEAYVLYFTSGGSVTLDLTKAEGSFKLTWIGITQAKVLREERVEGGQPLPLQAPYKGGWVAAIVRA
jgi:hypothetical protein